MPKILRSKSEIDQNDYSFFSKNCSLSKCSSGHVEYNVDTIAKTFLPKGQKFYAQSLEMMNNYNFFQETVFLPNVPQDM